ICRIGFAFLSGDGSLAAAGRPVSVWMWVDSQACCPGDPRTRSAAGQAWRGGRLRVSIRRSQGDHRRHARLHTSHPFALSGAPEQVPAAGRVGPVGGPYGGLPRLAPVPRVAPTVALPLRALSDSGALRTSPQRLICLWLRSVTCRLSCACWASRLRCLIEQGALTVNLCLVTSWA